MEPPPLEPALVRKEQDYIEHALLTPTYIRDPNNFIMDFMESTPLVFPNKTIVHVPNATVPHIASSEVPTVSVGDGNYTVKITDTDQLSPELTFHNSLFHFRQAPPEVVTVANIATVTETALSALTGNAEPAAPLPLVIASGNSTAAATNGYSHKHTHAHPSAGPYITLNGDFLTTSDNKAFCDAVAVNQTGADVAVQQFLLTETNVSLDDADIMADADDDVLYARSSSRKVLPHKKRISRKLRVSQNGVENVLPAPPDVHKLQGEQRLSVSAFSCEICGQTAGTQLQFFEHLKQHYEPTTPDTILAAMKTTLVDLETEKTCNELCDVDKKTVNSNVDQVFNDVQLNFAAFHGVDDTVRDVMDTNDEENHIKVINAHNSITKCMEFVAQRAPSPLKDMTTDEVEFSDTEDMLEGIRNVVDKVSIEDTCDDIDLMGANGMRATWFTNDNFSGIAFKNKSFNDVSFAETLPHMPIMESNQLDNTSKEPAHTLSHAQAVLTFPKEHSPAEKVQMQIPTQEDANRATYYDNSIPMQMAAIDDTAAQQPNGLLQPLHSTPVELYTLEHVDQIEQIDQVDSSVTTESEYEEEEEAQNEDEIEYENEEREHEQEQAQEQVQEQQQEQDNEKNAIVENAGKKGSKGKKQFHCTKCNRFFNSNNALKYHSRTHTGLRPHQCDTCGKSFYAQCALKGHVRTHTGDKPFECEHCHRTFRQWGDLKYHTISIHTEEKSHQCEFCGKAFSRKYSLVLHRRIHTSERNFKCDLCTKSFRASSYLQNHRRIHTGEKPHGCDVCDKRFRMTGDLRRHMRIHQDTNKRQSKKTKKET